MNFFMENVVSLSLPHPPLKMKGFQHNGVPPILLKVAQFLINTLLKNGIVTSDLLIGHQDLALLDYCLYEGDER